MHRLAPVILLLSGLFQLHAQSPHGKTLKIDCAACHTPSGWTINRDSLNFDHNTTNFQLEGTHAFVDCKSCHTSLIFDEAPAQCLSCHTDVHSASVGNACARCHTPDNWLVSNIPEIHEQNGFPLVGNHGNLNCIDCHKSETNLRFDRLGNDCFSCHDDDYASAKNPDHVIAGYSTNCIECHDPLGGGWNADILHDFFPLVQGHDINDCKRCHLTANYADASPECNTCHMDDYNSTSNPNHPAASISTNCADCHTIASWTPSTFDHSFYPIAGAHIPIENDCNRCHHGNYTNTPNTCAGCHLPDYNNTSNPNHTDAQFSTDCAQCHTEDSWVPSNFDHNTIYPLHGAHAGIANDCNRCHSGGYTNTPNTCAGCHLADYNSTTEPNHSSNQFSTDCAQCHTESSWVPATFDHNTVHPLLGAHAAIANDCVRCHSAGYTNTPNTCVGCHQADYNNTTNPNHSTAQFSTDCAECHSETSWTPATFDHDNDYFPIYSGKHKDEWNLCTDCHIGGNYATFSCINCHEHNNQNQVNNDHNGVSGYSYNSNACLTCHPDGD